MHPNEVTSAFSMVFTMTWITAAEAAEILTDMTVDDLTPEKFEDVYAKAWVESHEYEAPYNPDGEAALETIEAVKDEIFGLIDVVGDMEVSEPTNFDGAAIDADATGDDADAASTADEDSSNTGSGRKLTSTTVRAASAVLRMFGI